MTDKSKFSDLIETKKKEFFSDHLVTASRLWLQMGDVMNMDVITICPDQTITSAAQIMDENKISCLVVVEDTKVVGIITETDFLKRVGLGKNDFNEVRVADIMSSPVESILPDFSILEASRIAIDKHIKKLPILRRDGQLVGIVTQTDLIRALTSYGMWWDVSDIMNSDIAGIDHKATVAEAAEIMTSRNISCIVVLQADQVTGIFTERDLVKKVIVSQKDPARTKIEDVMSSPAISVPPDCSVFSASRIMEKANIRRLLCMDDKRLYGIVTQTDIFLAVKNKLQAEEERNIHILIIEDDQEDAKILQRHLSHCRRGGIKSEHALDWAQTLEKLNCRHFDLIFLDNRLSDGKTAQDVLENLRKENIDIPVIIITGQGDAQNAVELMKIGAHDYITKDKLAPDLIEKTIRTSAESHTLKTVQKHSEQILRQSEERYRRITNAVTDYVYTVRLEQGRPVETVHRDTSIVITSYSPQEFAADPNLWINMVCPEDRDAVLKQVSQCLSGEDIEPLEHRVICKNGTIKWLKSTLVRHLDSQGNLVSYDGLLQDITERKLAEEKLSESEQKFRSLVETSSDWIWQVDANGIYTYSSPKTEELLGYKPEEVIGKKFSDFAEEKEEVNRLFEQIRDLQKPFERFEKKCLHKDGHLVILESSGVPIYNPSGTVIGFQGIDRNITEWKKAEKHLKLAKEQAEQAQKRLEYVNKQLEVSAERANLLAQEALSADQAKSQFLANMSHEIRTPMNAIIGFCEVLSEEKLTNQQKRHVDIVCESAKDLLQLINDILDFSRIEAGKLNLEIVDCSLEKLLAVIRSLMRPQAREKDLAFEIRQSSQLPKEFRTDSVRLRQCLINLINNAIKFTETGHVYVNVQLHEIDGKPYIHFGIEDTGIGIPEEKQKLIFEKFMQADGSSIRSQNGTGLGLAITKQLAKLLGGELSLTSEVGKGSVFSLTIPVNVDVKSQPLLGKSDLKEQLEQESDTLEQERFVGRVLAAEDSPTNQKLVKLLLGRLGLEVTLAEDGKEALDIALSQTFDLIFMDVQMPNMNGYDATKALRKNGLTTPIVALTAHAMKGDREKCISAGCDDYLAKPIKRKTLVQIIRKYLPSKSEALTESIDSVKGARRSEVDQLSQLCRDEQPPEDEVSNAKSRETIITWSTIMETCGDEDMVEEIVKIFLRDAPQCVQLIAEAIRTEYPKDIKLYAHRLRGSARHVAAAKLAEKAYLLECIGDEKDIETAASLFDDLRDEFGKVISFLSEDDWIEVAKQQENSKKIEQMAGK
ncbi:MAG: CBS domain-containing protein [Planctomycetota bacterium]|jgi:PAS domain S-box-containing protein